MFLKLPSDKCFIKLPSGKCFIKLPSGKCFKTDIKHNNKSLTSMMSSFWYLYRIVCDCVPVTDTLELEGDLKRQQ